MAAARRWWRPWFCVAARYVPGATLRAMAASTDTVFGVDSASGRRCGTGAWLKMEANSRRLASLVRSRPGKGVGGIGLRRALVRSAAAARTASVVAVLGMGVWAGNHSKVSALLSAPVSVM